MWFARGASAVGPCSYPEWGIIGPQETFLSTMPAQVCSAESHCPPTSCSLLRTTWSTATWAIRNRQTATPNNIDSSGRRRRTLHAVLFGNPVCSPSRGPADWPVPHAGRRPPRARPTDTTGLADSETTIARDAEGAKNYRHMRGKWHLAIYRHTCHDRGSSPNTMAIPYSNDMKPRVLLHAGRAKVRLWKRSRLSNADAAIYTSPGACFSESENRIRLSCTCRTLPANPDGPASPRFRGKSPNGLYGDCHRRKSIGE